MQGLKSLKSIQSQIGFFRGKNSQPVHSEFVSREYMYVQLYFQLKGQKTVLIQLLELLSTEMKNDENQETREIKQEIVDAVNEVLKFSYIQLITNIEEKTILINNLVRKLPNAKTLSVSEKILKAILALNKVSKTFIVESTKEANEQQAEQFKKEDKRKDNSSYVICRICGEKIPENFVEEHTDLCISAFKNESKLEEIDKRLEAMQNDFLKGQLNVEWPGIEAVAENILFPLLNRFALIVRAREITQENVVAAESLMQIASFAKSLGANDICFLALEKRRCCLAFVAAAEKLQRTTSAGVSLPKQPSIDEFTFIKRISGGAYARVFLARKTNTDDIFAVKVLKRRDVLMKNQIQQVITERDILLGCVSPNIVSFFYSIPGRNNLYLFMEYLPGGDLYSLLEDVGCLDEESARVYTKQILEALKFLHGRGIIHRDLKPDNILIAADGNLKLTDFGLSYAGAVGRQVLPENKIVGTADYVAPEVVMCLPNGPCADYWSLGCIVYELVCGIPPFHRDNEAQTFDAILKGYYEPLEDVSPECVDFVTKLLNPDQSRRLGANGIQEIFDHEWLKNGDKNSEMPFIPTLSSPIDTEYFQTRYTFDENDELDIIEDIKDAQASRQPETPRGNRPFTQARQRDDLEFTKVSVEQLGLANAEAVKRMRRSRADSDVSAFANISPSKRPAADFTLKIPSLPIPPNDISIPRPQSAVSRLKANDDFLLQLKRKNGQ